MAEQHPERVGPDIHRQIAEGLAHSAADVGDAHSRQTAMVRTWRRFFEAFDSLIPPAVTLSPRPWSELYPAEIDGEATRTWFHLLALADAVTHVGHPAIAIPAGRDQAGMPGVLDPD